MNRFSDTKKMKDAFQRFKKSNPDLLYTFTIIGFPTETEEDFIETLSFLNGMKFNSCLSLRLKYTKKYLI